jgi:hypothetical protein
MNEIANSENFTTFTQNVIGALVSVAGVATQVFNGMIAGVNFVRENWDLLGPVIVAIGAALLAYRGIVIANSIATTLMTAATWGLNTALLASPIGIITLSILGAIGVIYLAVGALNRVARTSISATGIVVGAFSWLVGLIQNLLMGLLDWVLGLVNHLVNAWTLFANFLGNVFKNPISSIIYLFQGMADMVLALLQKIASAIDFVFGSNLADAVASWRSGLKGMADSAVATFAPNENYQKIMQEINLSAADFGLERVNLKDRYNAGYSAGENFNLMNAMGGAMDLSAFDNSYVLDEIANNTGSIKDAMNMSEEDLKYLRDIAEQEAINRFTTATITIDASNMTNKVENKADLDGVGDYLIDLLSTQVEATAAGVGVG